MFFYDYVSQPTGSSNDYGSFQSLPDLWSKEENASALHEAVSAVALMSLAHRSSLGYLIGQARQHYGNFLRLTAKAIIGDQEELKKDSILAAILCANFYEVSGIE